MSRCRTPIGPPEPASHRTIRNGVTFFSITCIVATIGYVIAGWDWIDAIYMVVITVFGVGYGEAAPVETPELKLFTIAVIGVGCSSLLYVVGGIVQLLAEGEIKRMLGVRNHSRELEQLRDHTIICGYGRVGQMLAVELCNQGQPLVILDRNIERVNEATDDGFLAVQGDAVDDDVLHRVQLLHAKTIATVLPDDATNVFITLTARDMSDSVQIIARAESPGTESKLMRGGASHVVMPAAIGAVRIAQLATAVKDEAVALPEDRYRMLQAQSRKAEEEANLRDGQILESVETGQSVESVESELEDLANMASNLTRSVVERRHEAAMTEGN